MRLSTRQSENLEISMAPLIDCVFLLLIFFLVSTMMKKADKDIDIRPPESSSAARQVPRDSTFVIGIDAVGAFYVEGESIGINGLFRELRRLAATAPGTRIRLDTDERTPFESVVQVMNICQFRQLDDVVIRAYDEKYNR